jgi:hypothetical protein
MGQLDVYNLEDTSLITILMGPMSTYFAEEIEASIESIVAYIYSTNLVAHKCNKLLRTLRPEGDMASVMYFRFLEKRYRIIRKSLEEEIMRQDPTLPQREGASHRKNMEKLDNKYN